jgi:hypothetical protein
MNIICKIATLALGTALFIQSTSSSAVPYGSSDSFGIQSIVAPCTALDVVSIPITVDVSSRIYTTAIGFARNQDPFNSYGFSYEMHLRDSADTTDIATSRGEFISSIASGAYTSFSDGEILGVPNGIAPGNYLLKFEIHASGSCNGTGLTTDGTVSYILLSSVFDRIFANGFSMVSDLDSKSPIA